MKNYRFDRCSVSTTAYTLALITLVLAVTALLPGCERPIPPGETYHKTTSLWPIFDQEKSEGVDPDGTKWKKETGDAICWLSTWEKEERYDKDGFLVYRKKRDSFFPLYSTEIEEDQEVRTKKGNILFWPYQSRRLKKGPIQ